jgi:hypothetical protein
VNPIELSDEAWKIVDESTRRDGAKVRAAMPGTPPSFPCRRRSTRPGP